MYKYFFSKTVVFYTIALSAVLLSGCNDLLHQEPLGQWTKDDATEGGFQSSVFTLYAKARGFHVTTGNTAMAIDCFRSEDAEKGSTAADGAVFGAMYDDFNYTSDDGLIQSYWTANYEIINLCNQIIADMKQAEEETALTEGDLINRSETHFFRAFAFFNLVRAFGEVPKLDFKVNDAAEANIPKSSAQEIYALIDADLTLAEQYLPPRWDPIYVGRLTYGAARSLHARTYLMRNDWQNTYTAATDVITTGIYNLNTPYSTLFRESGENCSESIWELQCTSTETMKSSDEIGSLFALVQGVQGAGDWALGWGWNTPTEELANAFEPGDPRKDETLLYFYKTGGDPASIPANRPWNEKPIANAAVIAKYCNKKAYTDPAFRTKYDKYGYWVNVRMIRYADVVLMAAEAANELGGRTTEALGYLEQVRARARAGNNAILPAVTTTEQGTLRTAIKHERRVELGMEYGRFYDLVRWGDDVTVFPAVGKANYALKHRLLPLPRKAVDDSNGILIQNPNY
jgi:hypothetical protein